MRDIQQVAQVVGGPADGAAVNRGEKFPMYAYFPVATSPPVPAMPFRPDEIFPRQEYKTVVYELVLRIDGVYEYREM